MKVTTVTDALKIIEENFDPLGIEEVGLSDAGGRYTAVDVVSRENVPAFDRSTVDGYAVQACETFGAQESLPAILKLKTEIRIGTESSAIGQEECCYIPTGAMLPLGANAVVMVEHTEVIDQTVHIFRQVAPGQNIIISGEDLRCNQLVIEANRKLRAPELGLLASLGINKVKVFRRPRLGILSTGDEVVPATTPILGPGQIRDSNGIALCYLAGQMGADIIATDILPDIYEVFSDRISVLLEQTDMVVMSGGSSMGNKDFTAKVLRELGDQELLIEGLAVRPGKPTLLAKRGNKPLLGLPGHPVSALNIFSLFGKALIQRLSGATRKSWRPSVQAVLTKNIPSHPGRTDFARVYLEQNGETVKATPIFGRSGLLRSLAEADGIIWVPEESDGILAGEKVDVFLWE